MSMGVWGILTLKKNMSYKDKINLAFQVIDIGANNAIGINIGNRVEPYFISMYKELKPDLENTLPFQLTGHSLTPDVEALFIGDGNEVYEDVDEKIPWESLSERMLRVQTFLEQALKFSNLVNIVLYINILRQYEFETFNITANIFQKTILELFHQKNNWTPSVKFIISKT